MSGRPWRSSSVDADFGDPAPLHVYRVGLRMRLPASGIAQRLPDGIAAFPDITQKMQWPASALARVVRPRSYRALTRHLLADLDWYLDPQSLPEGGNLIMVRLLILVMAIGALLFIFGMLTFSDSSWTVGGGLGIFCAAFLATGPYSERHALRVNYRHQVLKVRAEELYYYLLTSYTDADEHEGGEALPTAELLAEKHEREAAHHSLRTD